MAFKREGDSSDWLNILQKRRVTELLSFDIPEDEAHLIKNGRFACLVCSHRPIFDTVNMLALHRHGKKHLANLERFTAKKKELDDLRWKRQQEEYLKTGKFPSFHASEMGSASGSMLLPTSAPYEARVKKRRCKPYDRKLMVDLDGTKTHSNMYASDGTVIPQTIAQYTKYQKHQNQITPPPRPYIKKLNRGENETQTKPSSACSSIANQCGTFNLGSADTVTDSIKTINLGSADTATDSIKTIDLSPNNKSSAAVTNLSFVHKQRSKQFKKQIHTINKCHLDIIDNKSNKTNCASGSLHTGTTSVTKTSTRSQHATYCGESDKIGPKTNTSTVQRPLTDKEQKIIRHEKYLQLRGAGWKKDWSGNWIKDEEAEFDSDEEPPDLV